MLALRPLQRALDGLYHLDVPHAVDDFVRPLSADHGEANRREVVLVAEPAEPGGPSEIAVMLDPEVARALRGEVVDGLSRFAAWCLALEGVSHFMLLAFRAENDRPVSLLELELQAEVDKFVVALIDRTLRRGAAEAQRLSQRLRRALYDNARFHDAPDTEVGRRYRTANGLAARYAASLERRFVRHGRLADLIRELRMFYREDLAGKRAWAEAA